MTSAAAGLPRRGRPDWLVNPQSSLHPHFGVTELAHFLRFVPTLALEQINKEGSFEDKG
jgi:hypothetical protein